MDRHAEGRALFNSVLQFDEKEKGMHPGRCVQMERHAEGRKLFKGVVSSLRNLQRLNLIRV